VDGARRDVVSVRRFCFVLFCFVLLLFCCFVVILLAELSPHAGPRLVTALADVWSAKVKVFCLFICLFGALSFRATLGDYVIQFVSSFRRRSSGDVLANHARALGDMRAAPACLKLERS
jgi:hypothetical protein